MSKLLPPDHCNEDLARFSMANGAASEQQAERLAILYGSLNQKEEQTKVLLESSISSMQEWAAKLLQAMSSLTPIADLSEKTIQLEPVLFVALKQLRHFLSKPDDLLETQTSAAMGMTYYHVV